MVSLERLHLAEAVIEAADVVGVLGLSSHWCFHSIIDFYQLVKLLTLLSTQLSDVLQVFFDCDLVVFKTLFDDSHAILDSIVLGNQVDNLFVDWVWEFDNLLNLISGDLA